MRASITRLGCASRGSSTTVCQERAAYDRPHHHRCRPASQVFTASALDQPGRQIEHRHFPNSRSGHAAMFEWACRLGTVDRIGIEGASGLGRPLAEFLVSRRVDVRDVPPHKTSLRQRGRHEGKSDRLDAHRVAIAPLKIEEIP